MDQSRQDLRERADDYARANGIAIEGEFGFGIHGIVSRPFLLDFAGAYLDRRPDYPPEVTDEWRKEKEEQFGDNWAEVKLVLWELERMGIYMADVNPGNIAVREEPSE